MKFLVRGFLFFSLLFYTTVNAASLAEPGDGPYSSLNKSRILYVYDREYRDLTPQVEAYIETIHRAYEKTFNWKLDERQDLILMSPNQQVANAYATVIPNVKSVWYPSGAGAMESFAASSWYLLLAAHETSHLYQLDAKGPFSSALKTVLGNSLDFVAFVVPFFVNPNIFAPTFLLEGNAVLNESRANLGGRLHSGEVRALVLAQIHDQEITPTRLINDEFRYPYGSNAYFQGGYFQAHLAAKYGIEKTNSFFLAQSQHFIDPLILNKTFRDHFGASYPQEMREYVREWMPLANRQIFYPKDDLLIDSPYVGPMNHDEKSIFFLISDGLEMPQIVKVDKASGKFSYETLDVPMGKLFYPDGVPETAAADQHDLHHLEYSLYGAEHAFDSRFRSQIVNDQRAGKTVALSALHSQLDPQVLVNGEVYDVGHSQPVLNSQGDVFYFRQNGAERVLFKNRQPVFKFDGFYGKLTEVSDDGSIYFIANTDYGSTLYRYKNSEIQRVLESDRVVDARIFNDNEALAEEVAPEGHRLFRVHLKPQPARPALYAYAFPSYNLIPQPAEPTEDVEKGEHHYNSLREMRYSSLDTLLGYSSFMGVTGAATLNFTDPLQYQTVSATLEGSSQRGFATLAQYTYTRYLPQLYASYLFERNAFTYYDNSVGYTYDQQAILGVNLPILKWRHYSASVGLGGIYSRLDHRAESYYPYNYRYLIDETLGTVTDFNFQFLENPDPALSFYPWNSWNVHFRNELQSPTGNSFDKRYNTNLLSANYEQGFKNEFFATIAGNLAWAENHDIIAEYNLLPLTSDVRVPRLVGNSPYLVKDAATLSLEVNKVFNVQAYSTRFPLGLDRIAPFVTSLASWYDANGKYFGGYSTNSLQFGYGFDLQLLLIHTTPFKFRLMNAYDTSLPSGHDLQATFMGNFTF